MLSHFFITGNHCSEIVFGRFAVKSFLVLISTCVGLLFFIKSVVYSLYLKGFMHPIQFASRLVQHVLQLLFNDFDTLPMVRYYFFKCDLIASLAILIRPVLQYRYKTCAILSIIIGSLKGQRHDIFAFGFFCESFSPKPLIIALGSFQIFSKIHCPISFVSLLLVANLPPVPTIPVGNTGNNIRLLRP
jgi:hypothetical protein